MDEREMRDARLIAEFDQVIAEMDANGDERAGEMRDIRAFVISILDGHAAWLADPDRKPHTQ